MKLLYITETLPWGKGESFFYPEIRELSKQGVDIKVLTTYPGVAFFHPEAYEISEKLLDTSQSLRSSVPRLSKPLKFRFAKRNLRHLILGTGGRVHRLKKAIKNTLLLSRAELACRSLSNWKPDHIHAQWANYTATLAWIISEALKVPWSFTAHRYDLVYDNLLSEKAHAAAFVRITSNQALQIAKERKLLTDTARCHVSYMGAEVPDLDLRDVARDKFVVAVPAALIPRKGHKVLLRAIANMPQEIRELLDVRFFGDGPEKETLADEVERLGLSAIVKANGALPHLSLLQLYRTQQIDCVVLPTLNFADGLGEGIPFSLIEAMAHSVPVITTRTGGSPELLSEGAGVLVSPDDEWALADALAVLAADPKRRLLLGRAGYNQVKSKFCAKRTTRDLLDLIRGNLQ